MSGSGSCQTCRFWKRKAGEDKEGSCRRYPPVRTQSTSGFLFGGTGFLFGNTNETFPDADADDWCGEHQPNAARQPRGGSRVGLDAVVGNSGGEK